MKHVKYNPRIRMGMRYKSADRAGRYCICIDYPLYPIPKVQMIVDRYKLRNSR